VPASSAATAIYVMVSKIDEQPFVFRV